jgi:protein gp37
MPAGLRLPLPGEAELADGTHIEWTDATWNPITGCSVVSPGCTNCYAMKLAGTRLKNHPSRQGLTQDTKAGPVWTGEVRFNEQWLDQPLKWTKPRRIFTCAHGDLFAENVPDEWIDRVFAVMALCPQHTFQVLTKRAEQMRDYTRIRAGDWTLKLPDAVPSPSNLFKTSKDRADAILGSNEDRRKLYRAHIVSWPLSNVWLGVSVEDQGRADERIPVLLDTPAAVRFISAEPLLGPIRADYINRGARGRLYPLRGQEAMRIRYPDGGVGDFSAPTRIGGKIDWVITGGESGPNARPMHPDWARSLRDQCQAAGVPFFFKQWGEWHPCECFEEGGPCYPMPGHEPFDSWKSPMFDPDDREIGWHWRRLGKKAAGRLLDGREHSELPA